MDFEIYYSATDYQKITDVEITSMRPEDNNVRDTKLSRILLYAFLIKSQSNIDVSENKEGSIFIGRGETRKRSNIQLLADFESKTGRSEEDEDIEEQVESLSKQEYELKVLNGVVGVLSGIVYKEELEKYFTIDNKDLFDKLPYDEIKVNLQIKSRFDLKKDKSFFTASLLTYGNVKINDYTVFESDDEVFDFLLMDLFVNNLSEAFIKGYYKTYRRFEKNDAHVKGSIDISRHIKNNIGRKDGKIAYSYRENTIDNSLNALIIKAYDHLKRKYPELLEEKMSKNENFSRDLEELRRNITYVSTIDKLIRDNNVPIAHPYYQEYETVRIICLQILRDESVSIFDSLSGDVNGFLYYLPDLWEDFLQKIFEEVTVTKKVCVKAQNQFKYVENGNNFSCVAKPDFTFKTPNEEGEAFLVLDAKMKEKWVKALYPNEYKGSLYTLVGDDIDQILRYMIALDINGAGVVFPIEDKWEDIFLDIEGKIQRNLSKYNKRQKLYFLPFVVPTVDYNTSYSEWKDNFKKGIEKFKNLFEKMVLEPVFKQYVDNQNTKEQLEMLKLLNEKKIDLLELKKMIDARN